MIEKAKQKIVAEIEANKNNPVIKVVGDYLLQQIEINAGAAENILSKDKTIDKAMKKMEGEARKRVNKNSGVQSVCINPYEGFEMIREYFGFEAVQDKFIQVEVEEIREDHNIEEVKGNEIDGEFNVSLEDFM